MPDGAAIGYCQRWKRNAEVLACWKASRKIGLRSLGLPTAASADLAGVSGTSRRGRMYWRVSGGPGRLDLGVWAICFSCL